MARAFAMFQIVFEAIQELIAPFAGRRAHSTGECSMRSYANESGLNETPSGVGETNKGWRS